jgi:hypothetical protein
LPALFPEVFPRAELELLRNFLNTAPLQASFFLTGSRFPNPTSLSGVLPNKSLGQKSSSQDPILGTYHQLKKKTKPPKTKKNKDHLKKGLEVWLKWWSAWFASVKPRVEILVPTIEKQNPLILETRLAHNSSGLAEWVSGKSRSLASVGSQVRCAAMDAVFSFPSLLPALQLLFSRGL